MKLTTKKFQQLAVVSMAFALTSACGQNLFKTGESEDPAEDATIALEKEDPDAAIKLLEKELGKDPGNAQYLSILAAAYAQRAGVEPLRLAQNMANSPDTQSNSQISSMFSLFGPVTEQILADIDRAVSILTVELPQAQWQPGDDFKIAIYQTSSLVLHTKALDKNGDGQITPDEVLDLSDSSALGILTQVANSQALLSAAGVSNTQSAQVAAQITKVQAAIAAADGATDEEKLRNYLATTSGSSQVPSGTTVPAGTSLPSGTGTGATVTN